MHTLIALGAVAATIFLIAVAVTLAIAEPLGLLLAFGLLAFVSVGSRAQKSGTSMDEEVGR